MKPRNDSADSVAGSGCMTRLVRCSSFMDVDQRIDAVEKDLARLWCLVGVLAVACLILGADAWIQGDLIRRSSSQQHHEEAPLCLTRKKTNHMKTTKSNRPARCSRPTCSLLPVNFDGRVIMVDVSPMTVKEFKESAIKMLEAHIEWGKRVFPFISANAIGEARADNAAPPKPPTQ
jgi:hypothetical protein